MFHTGRKLNPMTSFRDCFWKSYLNVCAHFYLKSVFSSDTTCAGNRIGQKRKIISMRTVCGKVNLKSIHRSCVSTSTRTTGISKKACSNILPANTIYLDLTHDADTLLKLMKPKTRYNIGLSKRKGVNVRSMGMEGIDIWYDLYKETAERNNILLNDIKYFNAVLTARTDNTSSPANVKLLVAEFKGKPLAAMFLVISGNRGGSYLYGASSSQHRNLMATYALQWEPSCSQETQAVQNTICLASLLLLNLVIRFTGCTDSSQVSAAKFFTASAVGIIPLTAKCIHFSVHRS